MKDQTSSGFAVFRIGLIAIAVVTLLVIRTPRVGLAQTGSASPPPTYDWNDIIPGVQGPASPLLAGAEVRALRTLVVQVPVLIPLVELQAVLPPGFNAIASPAGSTTGQLTLVFIFHQRNTRIADGQTFGPASGMNFNITIMNTNVMPNRQELGLLGYEFSSQESVDFYDATFGPGSARLAKVNVQIAEDKEILSFKFDVTDDGLGLNVSAQATSANPLVTRTKNDPFANPNRFLIPRRSFYLANQNDNVAVPQAMANVKVDAPGGKLQVPVAGGGSRSLTIVGIGATITFLRNAELMAKME